MHNSFIFFITSFALLSLSACQSLEKVRCEENNWRQQAYIDALEGQTLDEATPTLKRCKERFNVDIRSEVYKEGFESGLAKLCTRSYGYEFGLKGYEYKGTCQTREEPGFLMAYRSGRLQYLKSLRQQLQLDIQDSEGRVWRKKNEYELEANSNPQAARQAYDVLESYRAELQKLRESQAEINARIAELTSLLN